MGTRVEAPHAEAPQVGTTSCEALISSFDPPNGTTPTLLARRSERAEVAGIHTPDLPAGVEWAMTYGPMSSGPTTRRHDEHTLAWPNRDPITFSDPLGRDGVTSNPIQDPVDSGFLPPGRTTFGKGAR